MDSDSPEKPQPLIITPGAAPTVYVTPLGFLDWGTKWRDFARQARAPREGFDPMPYYLYCRALELLLKAFLLTTGATVQELKDGFKHNLQTVLDAGVAQGLTALVDVTPEWRSQVVKANRYYCNKGFEYYEFFTVIDWQHDRLPSLDVLEEMCSALITGLHERCLHWEPTR
jgi:hypothetical protein